MWGGRCHGFCVPNTGMGQGGGTRQKHPLSAEVVRRRSAGSEAGQGEQKWDPWEGSLHRYRHVQGFLTEATVEGMEACGEGKLRVLG